MKANEAPEKLYINLFKGEFNVSYSPTNNSIEYVHTEAFIEKACFYIKDMVLDMTYSDVDGKDNYNIEDFIKCFRNYMIGE